MAKRNPTKDKMHFPTISQAVSYVAVVSHGMYWCCLDKYNHMSCWAQHHNTDSSTGMSIFAMSELYTIFLNTRAELYLWFPTQCLACNRTPNQLWPSAMCFPAETITICTVGNRTVWSKHLSVSIHLDRTQLLSNLHSRQIRTPEPLSIFTHWLLSDSYWMCHTAQYLRAAVLFDPLEWAL